MEEGVVAFAAGSLCSSDLLPSVRLFHCGWRHGIFPSHHLCHCCLHHREVLLSGPRASRRCSRSGWLSPRGSLGSRPEPFAGMPPSRPQTRMKQQGRGWLSSKYFWVLLIRHNAGTWAEIRRMGFFCHLNHPHPYESGLVSLKHVQALVLSNVCPLEVTS